MAESTVMEPEQVQPISTLPEATPISRLLRLALGVTLTVLVAAPLLEASWRGRLQVAGVVAGLIVFYMAVHLLVTRYFSRLNLWIGAAIAAAPFLLVFVAGGGGVVTAGAVLFVGLSLILIAATGHPGCEALAFPALFLGRRTHLACLVFSPIDWVEGKVTEMLRGARA